MSSVFQRPTCITEIVGEAVPSYFVVGPMGFSLVTRSKDEVGSFLRAQFLLLGIELTDENLRAAKLHAQVSGSVSDLGYGYRLIDLYLETGSEHILLDDDGVIRAAGDKPEPVTNLATKLIKRLERGPNT
ncbi:hypothetical protein [Roseomonas sp. USHLN139]|uniref:hypothetical protein n=1 Tax=Roseomonas sp. USHLN139 TaxID=3081298 RepID=UPI003B020E7D